MQKERTMLSTGNVRNCHRVVIKFGYEVKAGHLDDSRSHAPRSVSFLVIKSGNQVRLINHTNKASFFINNGDLS